MGMFDDILNDTSAPVATTPVASAIPQKTSGMFDDILTEAKQDRTVAGTIGDTAIDVGKGFMGFTEMAVGLADIPTGGKAGKFMDEIVGFRPNDAREVMDSYLSPAQQAANQKVEQAGAGKGLVEKFTDKTVAAIENPSVIGHTILESLPTMVGGAKIGQGIVKGAAAITGREGLKIAAEKGLAGAVIGEGIAGAGSAAEGIRQATPGGELSGKQIVSALGSGLGTSLFTVVGGKIQSTLKIGDIDSAIARGDMGFEEVKKGFVRRLVEGGISEGILEEMPQSVQEQLWQNYATDKPLDEGLADAASMGMLSGAAMGGPFAAIPSRAKPLGDNPQADIDLTGGATPLPNAAIPSYTGPVGGVAPNLPYPQPIDLVDQVNGELPAPPERLGLPAPSVIPLSGPFPAGSPTASVINGSQDDVQQGQEPDGTPTLTAIPQPLKYKVDPSVPYPGSGVIKGLPDAELYQDYDEAEVTAIPVNNAVDQAAHQAATSPNNNLPQPTQAQQSAGNYKKGTVKLLGLDIAIENPAGSIRKDKETGGQKWQTTMQDHYGYVRRTKGVMEGGKASQVDVFIGKNPNPAAVFVIDQINPKTGKFDEHKAMIGYDSKAEAAQAYNANYEQGWSGMGAITAMSPDQFKSWVKSQHANKPLAYRPLLNLGGQETAVPAKGSINDLSGVPATRSEEQQTVQPLRSASAEKESINIPALTLDQVSTSLASSGFTPEQSMAVTAHLKEVVDYGNELLAKAGKPPQTNPAFTKADIQDAIDAVVTNKASKPTLPPPNKAETIASDKGQAIPDRRKNNNLRARWEQMTPEEQFNMAHTDPKTGALNVAAWENNVQDGDTVASMDVSGLKYVNDNYGHAAGDALLKGIVETVKGIFDIYRLGGDEFAGHFNPSIKNYDKLLQAAQQAVYNMEIEAVRPDGSIVIITGWRLDYGTGSNFKAADAALYANRQEQEASGTRNTTRGGKPFGLSEKSETAERDPVQRQEEVAAVRPMASQSSTVADLIAKGTKKNPVTAFTANEPTLKGTFVDGLKKGKQTVIHQVKEDGTSAPVSLPIQLKLRALQKAGKTAEYVAPDEAVSTEKTEETFKREQDMTREEFIRLHRGQFVAEKGKRRIEGVRSLDGKAIFPLLSTDQSNGKLTRSVEEVLGDLHKSMVEGELRGENNAKTATAMGRKPLPWEAKANVTADVLKDYPELAQKYRKAPVAATEAVDTPEEVVAEAVTTAKEEGTPLKEQKKYLLANLDDAIKDAPAESSKKIVQLTDDLQVLRSDLSEAINRANRAQGDMTFWQDESRLPDTEPDYRASKIRDAKAQLEIEDGNISRLAAAEKVAKKALQDADAFVTIRIPDDGTFEVFNTKGAIKAFKEKVSKEFPAGPVSKQKTGYGENPKPTGAKASGLNDNATLTSTDGVWHTNGHVMVKGEPKIKVKSVKEERQEQFDAMTKEDTKSTIARLIPPKKTMTEVGEIEFIAGDINQEYSAISPDPIKTVKDEKAYARLIVDGKDDVYISQDYYLYVKEHHPNAKVNRGQDWQSPVNFTEKGEVVAIVMPINGNNKPKITDLRFTEAEQAPLSPPSPKEENKGEKVEAVSDEILMDVSLLRQSGDRWQYKFAIGSSWMTANTKEDAVDRATAAYNKAPEEERLTRAQRDAKAEQDEFDLMESNYGMMSLPELRKRYEEMGGEIAGNQAAGAREFNGNGGRRTGAAVSNEAAREGASERMRLGRYIAKRGESAPVEISTVSARDDFHKNLYAGEVSIDDFKAGFASILVNKEAILADIDKMTKPQIFEKFPGLQWRWKNEKKSDVVKALYEAFVGEFSLGEGVSYSLGKNSYENAVQKKVDSYSQQDLDQYAADFKKNVEERIQQRAALKEAVKDPKTREDFDNYIRLKKNEGMTFTDARLTLSPEQRATYDILVGESTRNIRKETKEERQGAVSVAGQTVEGQIIETKHTQKGHDLFVVQLAERVSKEDYTTLNAAAKKMGGYYSSFRGRGAVPGFQFTTRDTAEAFTSLAGGDKTAAQETVQERRNAFADDKTQTAAARLTEMADALDDKAESVMTADRKTNTNKRAAQAASADANARRDQALAQTMRNISAAIENGTAQFLDRVRQKVQVELLNETVRSAKWIETKAKYEGYAEQQKHEGEKATAETADHADWPQYVLYRSDLATLGRKLLDLEGTKKIGQKILKEADDVTDVYLDFAKENLPYVSRFLKKDGSIAAFKSRADAEGSIAASGYKGKAIVLTVKRNEHLIIMSPTEAIERGVWQGDNDKRITLSPELGAELVEKLSKKGGNKVTVPWQLERTKYRRDVLKRMGIETPAEFRAALREFIGLQEAPKEADKIKAMERAMVGRTKDGLDFFPTPETVADEMVSSAEIEEGMSVLEPSAGMGHIADRIREAGAEPDVVEMSHDRRELLEAKGFNLVGRDFMDLSGAVGQPDAATLTEMKSIKKDIDDLTAKLEKQHFLANSRAQATTRNARSGQSAAMRDEKKRQLRQMIRQAYQAGQTVPAEIVEAVDADYNDQGNYQPVQRPEGKQYDRIIMNPPFSDRRDAQHVQHAYTLLKPNGRIVAIMGEGVFFGQDKKAQAFRDWLDTVDATVEKLPEGTFLDPSLPVNTGVNARMVVIDRKSDISFSVGKLPASIIVNGKPRPTTNSNGKPIAKTEEGIKNFWNWFGDSKVIDSQGRPLVVYHGSPDVRGILKDGFSARPGSRDGFFASDSYAVADSYADDKRAFDYQNAEPTTISIYLSLQNPIIVDASGANWKETEKHLGEAKAKGHDGVIIRNSVDFYNNEKGAKTSTVYSFFSDTAAKSAMEGKMLSRVDKITLAEETANNGEFDPQDKNIFYSSAPSTKGTAPILLKGIAKRARLTDGWSVQVVASPAGLPAHVQAEMQRQGISQVEGVKDGSSKTVFLVASGLSSLNRAKQVLAHEVFHVGVIEAELQGYLNSLAPGKLAQWKRNNHAYAGYDDLTIANEMLAQETENNLWVKRIIGKINAWLKSIGIDLQLSKADVYSLIDGALTRATQQPSGELSPVNFAAAWHGSPHKFDKFKMSAIGTGEGAQAYGYGLYFSEAKDVARYYKEVLGGKRFVSPDGADIQATLTTDGELKILREAQAYWAENETIDRFRHTLEARMKRAEMWAAQGENAESNSQFAKDAKSILDKTKGATLRDAGRLYHVELAPAEDEYLLWDRPLSEQSEKVQAAIDTLHANMFNRKHSPESIIANVLNVIDDESEKDNDGADLYQSLESVYGTDKEVSELLHTVGIRGIKYLDGTSRSKGEGNFNYVIFSEDDVEITMQFSALGREIKTMVDDLKGSPYNSNVKAVELSGGLNENNGRDVAGLHEAAQRRDAQRQLFAAVSYGSTATVLGEEAQALGRKIQAGEIGHSDALTAFAKFVNGVAITTPGGMNILGDIRTHLKQLGHDIPNSGREAMAGLFKGIGAEFQSFTSPDGPQGGKRPEQSVNFSIRSSINQRLDDPKWQDLAERFVYSWLNTGDPRKRVYAAADKKTAKNDMVSAEELRGKKTAAEVALFREKTVEPMLKELAEGKLTVSDLEEYGHALHAPERNQRMREVNAKRTLDRFLSLMTEGESQVWENRTHDFVAAHPEGVSFKAMQNHYLDLIDELALDVAQREEKIMDRQDAFDKRTFTAQEITNGTPERVQKSIDKAVRDLEATKSLMDKWQDESTRLSGMTDEDAQSIVDKWEKDPRKPALKSAKKKLDQINRAGLDALHDSGELSDEEYEGIISGYQHYVPLMRDGFSEARPTTGRITGPTGKPLKVAMGSLREVVNIVAHSVQNYQTAVNRKHKAEAGRALYQFALDNPDSGITVEKLAKKPTHDQEGNVVLYPDQMEPDNGIFVKVDGEKHLLEFDTDERTPQGRTLSRFLDSLKNSSANIGPIMNSLTKVNRYLAMVNTMLSPEFVLSNFVRDFQTAFIHLSDEKIKSDKGFRSKISKDIFPAIKGIFQAETGNDSSPMAQDYREFAQEGGKIGWMQGYDKIEDLAKELEHSMKLYGEGHVTLKKLEALKTLVASSNTAVENGVRLATYRNLRDSLIANGKSPELARREAASVASKLTVDFTQKGKYGPALNSLYLFANAGIQGNLRMIQAIAGSKSVRKIVGGIVVGGFALQLLALAGGGDDDTGEPYILGLPDFVRERNLIFMLPGSKGRYISIPMPYGYNGFNNIGAEAANLLYMGINGKEYNAAQGAMRVATTFANSFNPLAAGTLLQSLSPTITDPIVMAAENKDYTGRNLMPQQNMFGAPKPDSERYWKGVSPTSKYVTSMVNSLTGGDRYQGGLVDMSPETLDMLFATVTGSTGKFVSNILNLPQRAVNDELDANRTPFTRRFVGQWDDRAISDRYYQAVEQGQIAKQRFDGAVTPAEKIAIRQTPEFKNYLFAKVYDAHLSKLRKSLRLAEAQNNQEQIKLLREKILTVQKSYLAKVK